MAPRVTQVRASPGKATEGPDGGTWEAGERVRHQVGTTLSSIAWSIREQAHGSAIWAESGADAQSAAIGGAPRGWGLPRTADFWGLAGRVGCAGALQVRPCKLGRRIHAAHAPAQPTRPATDRFLRGQPRKTEQKQSKAGRCALQCLISDISGAGQRPAPGAFTHGRRSRKSVGAGWWGQQDRWRHGWRHRAPWMGLRRVLLAPTTPPSHGNPAFAWAVAAAVAVALASAGAGRRPAKAIPCFRYNVGPVSQLRFPGHDGPRGRARPVAVPPRTS